MVSYTPCLRACKLADLPGCRCLLMRSPRPPAPDPQKLIAATLDDGRSGVTPEDRTRWAAVTQSLQLRCAKRGIGVQAERLVIGVRRGNTPGWC